MRIVESARKHGVAEEDITHGVRYALWEWPIRDEFVMRVGPDRAGNLLEIGIVDPEEEAVIVHAMRCRSQYLPPR